MDINNNGFFEQIEFEHRLKIKESFYRNQASFLKNTIDISIDISSEDEENSKLQKYKKNTTHLEVEIFLEDFDTMFAKYESRVDRKKTTGFAVKFFLETVFRNCFALFKTKGFNKAQTEKKENEPQHKEVVLTARELASQNLTALGDKIQQSTQLSHKEQLLELVQNVQHLLSNDKIYQSFSAHTRFNAEKALPNVLQDMYVQCVLDTENIKLGASADNQIIVALNTVQEKYQEIIHEKVELDKRKTKEITQYLKAKS